MSTSPAHYPSSTAAFTSKEERSVQGWGGASWGPILMGAVCAIGIQFIFTVLGIAMGTTTGQVPASVDETSVRTVGVAAGVWWLVTGTIALGAGGFVFGRLAGLSHHSLAIKLEAAAMWGVVALFGFVVIWSGTGMLSETASPISAISSPTQQYSAQQRDRAGTTTESDLASSTTAGAAASSAEWAESARTATRTASWWSFIGLLAGLSASIGGACAGASAGLGRPYGPSGSRSSLA